MTTARAQLTISGMQELQDFVLVSKQGQGQISSLQMQQHLGQGAWQEMQNSTSTAVMLGAEVAT